jgi:hypothetical protein
VRELRRIARPRGRVLVVLNGADHLRKLRDLIGTALAGVTGRQPPRWPRPISCRSSDRAPTAMIVSIQ